MQSEDATCNGVRVDGGMSSNDLLCQILADITGGQILRPKMTESTALGAAMVAGYQWGMWEKFGRGRLESGALVQDNLQPNDLKTIVNVEIPERLSDEIYSNGNEKNVYDQLVNSSISNRILKQITSKLQLPFPINTFHSSKSLPYSEEESSFIDKIAKFQVGSEVIDNFTDEFDIFYPTLEESVRAQRVSRYVI